MSNDLISRKALKQAIDHDFYEHYTKYHDTDQRALIDMVMDDIDEMPIAFDKEKVLEELNDTLDFDHDDSLAGITITRIWNKAITKSIKIVEKGGIDG